MALREDPIELRPWRLAAFGASASWLLALCWWHRRVVMDDPWITFRYAANVLAGRGWVFNLGEQLEGYSNFTWVLASMPALAANIEPLSWARVLSVAVLLHFLWWLCRPVDSDSALTPGQSPVAAGLLVACYPMAVWAMGGLETIPYAIAVAWCVVAGGLFASRGGRCPAWSCAGAALLLALSRPEGAMFFAIPLMAWWLIGDRVARRRIAMALGAALAVFALYNAWRWVQFGDLVPNTVRAKVGGSRLAAVAEGLRYLISAFSPLLLGLFAACCGVVATAVRELRRVKGAEPDAQSSFALVAGLAVGLQLAFAIATGGDWMPAARFLVPALPVMAMLAALSIENRAMPVKATCLGLALMAGAVGAKKDSMLNWCRWSAKEAGQNLLVDGLAEAGDHLRRIAAPDSVVAATEAGILPYHSGLTFIDMLGLVDAHIAKLPGGLHRKFDAGYVLSRKPDYILLGFVETETGREGAWEPDRQVLAHESFAEQFVALHEWPRLMSDAGYRALLPGAMVLYGRRNVEEPALAQGGDAAPQ